jgi:hypothetical protein
MRPKKLQGIANTICHVFCGWRLISSKPILVKLGSGILDIDALTGHCTFNDKRIEQLPIAEEIRFCFQHALSASKISITDVSSAHVTSKLSFSNVPWNEQTKEIFYSRGKSVRTKKMHRCVFECACTLTTNGRTHRSELTDIQQWPFNWPDSTALSVKPYSASSAPWR